MRILITGGAGYVGNELVYLLAKNQAIEKIVIYDNLSRKNYNIFLDNKFEGEKIQFIRGELLDSRKIEQVLKEIDVVYHLAAIVSTPFASEDSHLFEQVNHWGTAGLVHAVEQSQVKRFIYTSSSSVYGESEKTIGINAFPNPKTFYGSSKLRGEAHVERLFNKIPTHIFRCGNVYGYSPSIRFDAVINRFMFEANFFGRVQISGNGMQSRSFIHVDKVVGVLESLLSTELASGTYNLVDKNLSILEIIEVLKEIFPNLETHYINQHLAMRQLKVTPDERLFPLMKKNNKTLLEEFNNFKNRFAFSTHSNV